MGVYLLLRLGLISARALSFKRFADLCARLGRMAGRLSPARRVVAANLRALEAAGGKQADPSEVFAAYGRYWGELLALVARPERFHRLEIELQGREHLSAAAARGPICFLGAHLGNWDLLAQWLSRELPGTVYLAERLEPPRLFRLFCDMRAALGGSVLAAEGSGRALFRLFKRNGSTGLITDRVIGAGWREIPFLGKKRNFPSAGMDIARRTGVVLLPIFLLREESGYVIRVHPPLPEEGDPLVHYARILEGEVLRHPEQWCLLSPLHDGTDSDRETTAARSAEGP